MSDLSERTSVRSRTREDLFQLIAAHDELTRPGLAELTGMSRSTINNAVGRLLAEGRILETEVAEKGRGSGSGRPATKLVAVATGLPVAGVDFGHNHVQVAIADALGRPLGERYVQTDVDVAAASSMDLAARLLDELLDEHDAPTLGAIVAGIPGPLDARSGRVRSPTILSGWVELAPAAELESRLGAPVHVENDALLGAYGELRRGAGRPHSDFVYIKASHGIGASVIIGGRPYRGATGLAGEIGHITLPGRTESCRCGDRGCLEAVVSIDQVRRQVAHAHPHLDAASLDLSVSPSEVTLRILQETGRTLGAVLAALCDVLNPSALIIGGEMGGLGPQFLDGITDSVRRRAQPATADALDVLPAALGVRAELVGALELASESARRMRA